jgi:hypothetical protein
MGSLGGGGFTFLRPDCATAVALRTKRRKEGTAILLIRPRVRLQRNSAREFYLNEGPMKRIE